MCRKWYRYILDLMFPVMKKSIKRETRCELMQNISKYLHEVLITDLDKESKKLLHSL